MARDDHHEAPPFPGSLSGSKQDGMNLREARQVIDTLVTDPDTSRVYGQPYETSDGATVIPVAKVRGRSKPGSDDTKFHLTATPLGVFVIKDGRSMFTPAVDGTRLAAMGILVGLVSAALAGIAMVRRPPWPDLHGDISR
jgi:hypothetical protein